MHRSLTVSLLGIWVGCGGPAPAPVTPVNNVQPAPKVAHARAGAWQPSECQQILSTAGKTFRARAPSIFPDYATLGWDRPGNDDPPEAHAVSLEISPGRTWRFIAAAASDDVITTGYPRWFDGPAKQSTWTPMPDAEFALTREADGVSLLIFVETERSSVELPKHPLVLEFVAEMKAALDACAAV